VTYEWVINEHLQRRLLTRVFITSTSIFDKALNTAWFNANDN